MVVSRNALTLDDNLTCEPAYCFLTWCVFTFLQFYPVYCALAFIYRKNSLSLFQQRFFSSSLDTFSANSHLLIGKFLGRFSAVSMLELKY